MIAQAPQLLSGRAETCSHLITESPCSYHGTGSSHRRPFSSADSGERAADTWNGRPGAKAPVALFMESPGPSCLRLAPQATGSSGQESGTLHPIKKAGSQASKGPDTETAVLSFWGPPAARGSSQWERLFVEEGPRSPGEWARAWGHHSERGFQRANPTPFLLPIPRDPEMVGRTQSPSPALCPRGAGRVWVLSRLL